MSDLISRKDVLHELDWCDYGLKDWQKWKLKTMVRDIPSAYKKGEWIEISSTNHVYKCSECGRLLVNVTDGKNNVFKHYPYCHCGADMRGEEK